MQEDGTAKIIGFKGDYEQIKIPVELNGHAVTAIEGNPFSNTKIKTLGVEPDHPVFASIDGVLFRKADKQLVAYPPKSEATEYAVPNGIRTIGERAFYGCSSLKTITLPEGITTIGDLAFRNCTKLKEVIIPESVIAIGEEAFGNCNGLKSITIPVGVTELGKNPFLVCENLTEITVADGNPVLEVIDGVLFKKDGEEKQLVTYPAAFTAAEYTVPAGVTAIGDDAFWFCENIQSVVLSEGVKTIGEYSFARCRGLTNVTLPDTLTDIGIYAFSNCSKLPSMVIPEGITVLKEGVFQDCTKLTSITLPASLTDIDERAFAVGSISSPEVTMPRGSYAEEFVKKYHLSYTYPDADNTDWLND